MRWWSQLTNHLQLGAAEVSNSFISYLNPVASVVLLVNKSRYFFGCLLLQLQLLGFFFLTKQHQLRQKRQSFILCQTIIGGRRKKSHHLSAELGLAQALNTCKTLFHSWDEQQLNHEGSSDISPPHPTGQIESAQR